jgi:hypothetical protein
MAKRRARSQIGNFTPNHKKSKIDPIFMCEDGVQHTIRKLLMMAITLLETSSESKVCTQSYGAPKS